MNPTKEREPQFIGAEALFVCKLEGKERGKKESDERESSFWGVGLKKQEGLV